MSSSRCAFCGSPDHSYGYHYPPSTRSLYEKLKKCWEGFLSSKFYCVYTEKDMSTEDALEWYADLADEFCKEYNYSEGLKEMAFFDYWWDTLADIFFRLLRGDKY